MRLVRLAVLIAAISLFFGVVANAEGYWTSSICCAVYPNFQSRTFYDAHNDANSTNVRFDSCYDYGYFGSNVSAAVRLYREVPFWPAEDRGLQRLYCVSSATGYYGEQPTVGNFHWTMEDVDGGYHAIDVPYLETDY
jgi:hypothetical protein